MTPGARAAAEPERVRAALSADGGEVQIRETHISWVFLTAERAYKLKSSRVERTEIHAGCPEKPVVLPFLKLRHACAQTGAVPR
ncbi:MAG TPA: hypothetical protein VGH24_06540 [Solirubrobacteraceae bacterium]